MTPPAAPTPVAVTGLGLVTPAGVGVTRNWERIRSGIPAASSDPELAGLDVTFSCRVPDFDGDRLLGRAAAWRMDRCVQLAVVAAREAIADAGLDPATWDGTRIGVVLGNSLGGSATAENQYRVFERDPTDVSPMMIPMSMVNMVAGYVAMDCGARGPGMVTATACASGTTAIGVAQQLLRSGGCDIVLAGGTESALSPVTMTGLVRMGALSGRNRDPGLASRPFDRDRDGFVAAEGAGVLVLERAADARARGHRARALVAGYGSAADAYHVTRPEPSGAGIERALRAALADAGVEAAEVDHVNAHGTSTPLNDVTEGRALRRTLGQRPVVTSTKGVTGHTLAAAGAIEAAYTVLTIEQQVVPPTANLENLDSEIDLDIVAGRARAVRVDVAASTSLGFGGNNAALVFTAA
ncbi:beta-ketoacyl-[acyl-carrier-protein] synthase family protein [Pseudonocardia spinosispora]|uniref:beta-ketoacyl-[acyl-carrier-protein] synthase family protein n=1 Tax=Pseudonocardia spinosispora TaxID=103441 RepID=UPI000490B8FB|nr:beta-ketoacyl-[acyl-carrier-protein] synthase family protein [Pseudonocardia spinosispora]